MIHIPLFSRLRLHTLNLVHAQLIAAILLIALFSACSTPESDQTEVEEWTPVEVGQVRRVARSLPIRTSGRLAAKLEAKLSFKIGGVIDAVLVEEGRRVTRNQLLARLDPAEIDARVAQAEVALEKARRDYRRAEALYRDTVATLEQLQNAESGLAAAQAQFEEAAFNRKHAEIRAPSDGSIHKRLAEAGELAGPGQPILLFGSSSEGWVLRTGIADRDVVRIQRGDEAELHFDAFPDKIFHGRVTEIASAADPMSGTFETEIRVEDPESLLRSGFIASADIRPERTDTLYLIPTNALVGGDGRSGRVFVLSGDNDRVEERTVPIARILDDSLALSGGLSADDRIVVTGAPYLADGDPVHVVQ